MKKTPKKKAIRTKGSLTPRKVDPRIQGVNDILHKRAKEMKWTAYGLAKAIKAVGGKTSEQSAGTFLKGGGVRTENLGPLLAVLGLEIRPKE